MEQAPHVGPTVLQELPVQANCPKFSLVLATVGRTSELERFLMHLNRQSYRKLELILVDQNPDDRLIPLVTTYRECFPVIHCRSAIGLSRARNVGLAHAAGDILAFP